MSLRVSDYVIQILNTQRSQHPERTKLFPVLPIVLHTGKRRWRKLNPLADRIVLGRRFREVSAGVWKRGSGELVRDVA